VHVLGVHQKEDGVTADEAGASVGKNLAKGKNPKTIDQGTSQAISNHSPYPTLPKRTF